MKTFGKLVINMDNVLFCVYDADEKMARFTLDRVNPENSFEYLEVSFGMTETEFNNGMHNRR